jgi:hypothetical protein
VPRQRRMEEHQPGLLTGGGMATAMSHLR